MPERLEKMDKEKRDRIINAAMKEFSANRFDKASTNAIVKEAGISKGLLFHYFNTKEDLFQYLTDFSMHVISDPIAEKIGYKEQDIILRMEKIMQLKLEIMQVYPHLIDFSKIVFAGMTYENILITIQKYHPVPIEMYYTHNIDTSLFKEGIDRSMAITTIQSTLEKLAENYVAKRNMGIDEEMATVAQTFKRYLDHFRAIYYKEAYHD